MQKIPHALEQLGMCATNTEPMLWSPGAATTEQCGVTAEAHPPWSRVAQREKAGATRRPRGLPGGLPLLTTTGEKPERQPRPSTAKINM